MGMPFGTACGRLRKAVMFSLVQKLELDKCIRCDRTIETPEELSMDHVIDWLGGDKGLFWDVENVKFAHLTCNRPRKWEPEHAARVKFERHCKVCLSSDKPYAGRRWVCVECWRDRQRIVMRQRRQVARSQK